MTARDKAYAELLLAWARTVEEHGLTFEAWLERRAK